MKSNIVKHSLRTQRNVASFFYAHALASHFKCKQYAWNNSKIITTNQRYHQRRCLEAWHINSAHLIIIAPLNRDDGGLLPDAYLHLINR